MTTRDPKEKLALGRLRARQKAKYFQELFLSFVPTVAEGLGTVGATKNMLFLWDPEAIAEWPAEWMEFAWWHEAMHVILRHHDRMGKRHPQIWNLAGDCFINDQGREAKFVIPPWAVTPEKYGLPNNLTTEDYYDRLW